MIRDFLHSLLRAILDGIAYAIATIVVGWVVVPPEWLS